MTIEIHFMNKVDGGWSDFGPWMCSCYTSSRFCVVIRRRYCVNPVPQNGGNYCKGKSSETKEKKVEKDKCKSYRSILNYLAHVKGKA